MAFSTKSKNPTLVGPLEGRIQVDAGKNRNADGGGEKKSKLANAIKTSHPPTKANKKSQLPSKDIQPTTDTPRPGEHHDKQ